MDVGVYVGDVGGPVTLEQTLEQTRSVAAAGLSSVWTAQALGWDSLTLLAVLGAAVPGIGLGSAVVPVPQRHPLVLAGQALSVQAAVGGRLTLGIGAGIGAMVTGMYGLRRDKPALRMREYLTALLPLLRGEAVELRSETLTAVGQVQIPAVDAPRVLLAALGSAMLRVAGEHADGAVTWMTGPRTLDEHVVPVLTRAAVAADRDAPDVVAGLLVCVTNEVDAARAFVAERYRQAAQVPEYRAVLDREGAAGAEDVAVIGNEAMVTRALERFDDVGVTHLAAAPFGTTEQRARTQDVLAALSPRRAGVRPATLSPGDRIDIHELVSLHGHLADDRRADQLGLLLTQDAAYDLQSFGLGRVEGLDAIRQLHDQRPGDQPAGHHVTNVVVSQRVDGTVTVRSKGLAVMPDGRADTCIYDDQLAHTAAGWRIAERRISRPTLD